MTEDGRIPAMDASLLPEVCVHDNEPDICDGCHYAQEKALRDARIHARAALAEVEARVSAVPQARP